MELSTASPYFRHFVLEYQPRLQALLPAISIPGSLFCLCCKEREREPGIDLDRSRLVQKADNTIHQINHYPADSVVCFVNAYPLDSDLSGDGLLPVHRRYPDFEQLEPGGTVCRLLCGYAATEWRSGYMARQLGSYTNRGLRGWLRDYGPLVTLQP